MFNLDACIHFHKIEIAVFINQKLNSSYTFVIHRFGSFNSRFTHFFTQFICHEWRRCFLNQLLMSSLNRTISFRHVTGGSVLITGNLNFNMAWFFNVFLHVNSIVSESCSSLLARRIPCMFDIFFFPDDSHSFTTTTGSSFHDYWINYFGSLCFCVFQIFQ